MRGTHQGSIARADMAHGSQSGLAPVPSTARFTLYGGLHSGHNERLDTMETQGGKTMSFGYDPEVFYQDADIEMRELRREANESNARRRRARRLRAEGKLEEAADTCPHLANYPLDGPCAEDEKDPRAGEKGERCVDCLSVIKGYPFQVLHPCEPDWPGRSFDKDVGEEA